MDLMAGSESDDEWNAYDERYDAVSITGVSDDPWDGGSVVEEQYHAAEVGTILSLDYSFFARPDPTATPLTRVLSALRALRPRRPPGFPNVPLALRYARFRLTRSLSTGVRSIRRHILIPTRFRATAYRHRPPSPPPPPPRHPLPGWVNARRQTHPARPRGPLTTSAAQRLLQECTACRSELSAQDADAIRVPCGHLYHPDCLVMLANVAMATPSQFPPRCCRRTIPTSHFLWLLTSAQRETFTLLQTERSTARPLYCANPRCSRFLGARDKRVPVRIVACSDRACTTRTCARCKAAVEGSTTANTHVCAHTSDHRAVVQLGTRLGWVRCPGCEQLVERNGGCPHMTCRCGTEFCYFCGRRYGGCVCHDESPVQPRHPQMYIPILPAVMPLPNVRQRTPPVSPPPSPPRSATPDATFAELLVDEPYIEDLASATAWRQRRRPRLHLVIPREPQHGAEPSLSMRSDHASIARLSPISSADESEREEGKQGAQELTAAAAYSHADSEDSPLSPGPATPPEGSFTAFICRRGELAQQARGRLPPRRAEVIV
ncbi:hypothetical protein BC628DRAFT_201139 [Trametes gibbosa]|nr:hypothetical protein BC628DRAFT_201139 [Trametes gibbosa]